jgi:dephospho-CoA kinase
MIIIGITGTLGAGKGTVVDYLVKKKGFKHYSVRGYIADIISNKGETVNRDTLTHTANLLRQQNGPAYIIEELYDIAASGGNNCVIESIRTPGEITALRQKPNFYLLAIDADIHSRYERIQLRNSETDDVSFETFKQNEIREMFSHDPNKQNLSECIKQADFVLNNDGNMEELVHNISNILKKIDQLTKQSKSNDCID